MSINASVFGGQSLSNQGWLVSCAELEEPLANATLTLHPEGPMLIGVGCSSPAAWGSGSR